MSIKDPEPQPPKYISLGESEYNGRKFYGDGMGCNGHADMRSEVTYLRDWQAWARRRLKSLEAFERGVSEALNSGDGSYRPPHPRTGGGAAGGSTHHAVCRHGVQRVPSDAQIPV